MVKLLFAIVIIPLCTLLGRNFTDKYFKRLNYFEQFLNFNRYLKQNLLFKRENLVNLLDFTSSCEDFLLTLSSFKTSILLEESYSDIFIPDYVEQIDREIFIDYFSKIGKGNLTSELDFLSSFEIVLNEKLLKIKDNNSKFSKLGQKLGFAVGMAVTILII